MYTVSITSQGQISIPAKIRRELGLDKSQKAVVSVEEGKMVVKPIRDFFELKGSLKTNKRPITSQEIHERFAEYIARKVVSKHK